ncbi:U4/U6 x U5 tri-snRNP complex subunit Prp38 [Schizosaccharomyces pombe]|uniref:Pre-mRNA-splicing factor 38 n=1 Tax=Schizosaccharomyces pombe (strain 972 / ATCC 24843) TaxID=284812 RepID=PRP38_SCHPO|nr:putative U4/U5/U6 small nuclear ribonucleoprotein complex subunit PRP38 [Schizosaccharomyces pombe]Q9UUD2.1 RecName: Full=Pre-mRNA-splicing factor 38 [Schizosaccharomyces pombe 972h-]CAB52035.1 U4/U6 x U5 tri-snRNP complex subunit Prp38 (predicted) [Schizosaccharomyces pombe]|eukprot:NP_595693.1 putative U4/U5/U6 small nuclear ribonucleoprotein complex subunit PRP38 [Schizosaccharomyces pombe]
MADFLARDYRSQGEAAHEMLPTFLIGKILRERIVDSIYWKEQCFGLNACSLVDRAVRLEYIGGQYGNQRPTEFICLLYKLLQIAPEKEIIQQYLSIPEFKYLRALAAFYVRLTWDDVEVHQTLEPLLRDYRKLRIRTNSEIRLTYLDEVVDDLLNAEVVCDISLPPLRSRLQLEDLDLLEPLSSSSDEEDDDEEQISKLESNEGAVDRNI